MKKTYRRPTLKTIALCFTVFLVCFIMSSCLKDKELAEQNITLQEEPIHTENEEPVDAPPLITAAPPVTTEERAEQIITIGKAPIPPETKDPVDDPSDNSHHEVATIDKNESGEMPGEKEPLTKKLDEFHKTTIDLFQDAAFKTDNILTPDEGIELAPLNKSRFSMAIDLKLETIDGPSLSLDLDIKSDINLPKTKKRLGVFLDTSSPDELPGQDDSGGENAIYAGLRTAIGRSSLPFGTFRVGVKVRVPPIAYTELLFRHHMTWGQVLILPQLKGYWFSDDGFGEITSLTLECLPTANTLVNSVTAVKWGETTDGIEWEQSLLFGHRTGRDFKRSPQSISIKLSVFGHKRGTNIIDLYRATFSYRRAIYKKWLYFQGGPELEFENERDWEPAPAIRVGIDMLFWAPEDLLD